METEKKQKLSIIIPVYNEEQSVADTISKIKSTIKDLDIDSEIIAVNDGSSDNSGKIINGIEGIVAITHAKNKGYGASLKTGIKHSKSDWILITDADGTYPIEAIPELLEYTSEFDQVIGSREKKDNAIPINRKYAKKTLNRFASYLAGKRIPDLNSGLRIFRKEMILKYWDLFPNKFSFTSTSTMTALTHGYETIFVPINYYKRQGKSSIKPVDFIRFVKLVTKLSLFFKPMRVFGPISLLLLLAALVVIGLFIGGVTARLLDTTLIVLFATALQTFFFGLLAEIVIHKR